MYFIWYPTISCNSVLAFITFHISMHIDVHNWSVDAPNGRNDPDFISFHVIPTNSYTIVRLQHSTCHHHHLTSFSRWIFPSSSLPISQSLKDSFQYIIFYLIHIRNSRHHDKKWVKCDGIDVKSGSWKMRLVRYKEYGDACPNRPHLEIDS
jgi:hypothetical protein